MSILRDVLRDVRSEVWGEVQLAVWCEVRR